MSDIAMFHTIRQSTSIAHPEISSGWSTRERKMLHS